MAPLLLLLLATTPVVLATTPVVLATTPMVLATPPVVLATGPALAVAAEVLLLLVSAPEGAGGAAAFGKLSLFRDVDSNADEARDIVMGMAHDFSARAQP